MKTIKNTEKSPKEDKQKRSVSELSERFEMSKPRIVVGIPAFNEELYISEVVRKARKFTDEVIVVDDGSTDKTAQVAEANGGLVIKHKARRGVGNATRSCFEAVKTKDIDVLVTLDGDNQHDADEIAVLIDSIIVDKADIVIGSRFMNGQNNVPKTRRFGIAVITWLFNIGSDVRISDAQSCFRAYGKKAITSLNITEHGFGFSVELLEEARQKGLNITEVPISCIYHSACHSADPLTHGLGVAFTVVKFRLRHFMRRLIGGNGALNDGLLD
jgi:glycosyltransferase involved in cell wall biosynthesis